MTNTVLGQKAKKISQLVKSGEKTPKQAATELAKIAQKEPSLRPEIQKQIMEWDIEEREALRKYVRSRLIEKSLEGEDDKVQISALKELTKFTGDDTLKSGEKGGSGQQIVVTSEGAQVLVAVMNQGQEVIEEEKGDVIDVEAEKDDE